jgi:phospholipid/cholesterol/gamma-HCH transport system substrate-binding protein
MNKAIWLGFFFFVSLVLLLYGALAIDRGIRFSKALKIKFDFDKIEGLREGDDIKVDGLKIGKVAKIELRPRGVRVVGHVEEEIELHEGSLIFVESFTLLGGNFISISRGDPDRPLIPKDTVLQGKAKPSALDQVGKVLSENKDLIREMLASVKASADEAKELVKTIRTGDGTLPRLINDPKIFDGLLKAVEEFRLLAEKANNGTGTLGKLVNDPSLYDELKGSLTDIRAAAASARVMIDKLTTGQGALGKFINDPKMAEDLEKLMENLRASSEDLKQIMGKIAKGEGTLGKLIQEDTIYEKGKNVLDSADNVLGRVGRARVFLGSEYTIYADNEYAASKLFLRIWPDETKYFQAGVTLWSLSATGPTITFEKQVEEGQDDAVVLGEIFAMYKIPWFFDHKLGVRVGLIEGKPGGGLDLDLKFGDWPVLASFDIRDAYGSVEDENIDENIHGPMTRASVKFPLWSPGGDTWVKQVLHAVKVTAGMSRLQDDPEFFIGGGIEFEDQDIRTLIGLLGLSR